MGSARRIGGWTLALGIGGVLGYAATGTASADPSGQDSSARRDDARSSAPASVPSKASSSDERDAGERRSRRAARKDDAADAQPVRRSRVVKVPAPSDPGVAASSSTERRGEAVPVAVPMTTRRESATDRRPPASATERSSAVSDATAQSDIDQPDFTGRPSLVSVVAVAALRVVRFVTDLVGLDFGTQLAPLIASDRPPRVLTLGLTVRRDEFDGMPVWTIQPKEPSDRAVVAMHGGAYVVQPTLIHWLDYATMARRTNATVVVPIYPLAPEATASEVVPLVADFLTSVIAERGSRNVSVIGDSAGGGLALSTAQLLVRRSAATPYRMVLLSPWLDVSMTNPAIRDVDDPILNPVTLKKSGRKWAGRLDPTDPLVSPLYGSLAGLPPTAVYAGSLDVLSPDVLVLRDRAASDDAPFSFVLRRGQIHDWAIGPLLPEAAAVRPQIYEQLFGSPADEPGVRPRRNSARRR
ncbi:alpha/beta hydrolase fold domain-containing protein [Mycobacterium sp. SMC-4]|uniref:alpha/beta hydrolase fold domain-containing protein n=1 Tax=Mycobacterium sp. SMC-4 TaxID=2857059 RepID=UPI003D02E88C